MWHTGADLLILQHKRLHGDAYFKEYDDYGVEDELFHFVAAGNNRDGLALRAASHLMELSPKPKKLLFMFSDASPQDDQIAGEGAFYKDREYTDALAVKDTVNEVQMLKTME